MKTIKELAKEYVDRNFVFNNMDEERELRRAVRCGIKISEQWIRVEYELPNPLDKSTNSEPVLVKIWDGDYYDVKQYSTVIGWFPMLDYEKVTHWRPINRK